MLCKIVLPPNEIFKLPALPKTFQDLQDIIRSRLGGVSLDQMILKYLDSDKELVILNSEEDFRTAVLTSEAEQIKTLKIYVQPRDTQSLITKGLGNDRSAMEKSRTKFLQKRGITPINFDVLRKGKELESLKGQLGAIDNFVGIKVKEAVSRNMQNLLMRFVGQLRGHHEESTNISKSAPLPGTLMSYGECVCSECKKQIHGTKYVCLECKNYKCCETCETAVEHAHPLLKFRNPSPNKQSNMFLTPEKKGSSEHRLSFSKSAGEKEIAYSAKISLENLKTQSIKTYPLQEEKVIVTVRNTGVETWPINLQLRCVNGVYRNREEFVFPLKQGEQQTLTLYLRAPCRADRYLSQWRLYYNEEGKSKSFGESLFIELQVEDKKVLRESVSSSWQSEKKASVNLVKRARTLTDSYLNNNEENKSRRIGSDDEKMKAAEWLNEVFPGDLEEKVEFIENCTCKGDAEDLSKIVEMYLQSLVKKRTERAVRTSNNFVRGEGGCTSFA